MLLDPGGAAGDVVRRVPTDENAARRGRRSGIGTMMGHHPARKAQRLLDSNTATNRRLPVGESRTALTQATRDYRTNISRIDKGYGSLCLLIWLTDRRLPGKGAAGAAALRVERGEKGGLSYSVCTDLETQIRIKILVCPCASVSSLAPTSSPQLRGDMTDRTVLSKF